MGVGQEDLVSMECVAANRARFSAMFLETLKEVLVFSDVVLKYVEYKTGCPRGEVVFKPECLSEGLRDLFGDSSVGLEKILAERFAAKMSVEFCEPGEGLCVFLRDAYSRYLGEQYQ